MIAVVADDFTGAAEIGGLGIRYGLKVEIRTIPAGAQLSPSAPGEPAPGNFDPGVIEPASQAAGSGVEGLLVIAGDTRSGDRAAAAAYMRSVTAGLAGLHPRLFYKKLDSVLRGHVIAELTAQMEVLGASTTLIVPANPAFERTIRDGIYYVKGKQLRETGFGADPEFTPGSSRVLDMLEGAGEKVVLAAPESELPPGGLVIGEASTSADLDKWAWKTDKNTLAAGASGFFAALLERHGFRALPENPEPLQWGAGKLFVCGSSFASGKQWTKELRDKGLPVSLLSEDEPEADEDPAALQEYAEGISVFIRERGFAVISAGHAGERISAEAARGMRERMAAAVEIVMREVAVDELFLEGGATAAAVLKKLRFGKFYPRQELAHGVIRMEASGNRPLFVTVKPGSYPWPPAVLELPGIAARPRR